MADLSADDPNAKHGNDPGFAAFGARRRVICRMRAWREVSTLASLRGRVNGPASTGWINGRATHDPALQAPIGWWSKTTRLHHAWARSPEHRPRSSVECSTLVRRGGVIRWRVLMLESALTFAILSLLAGVLGLLALAGLAASIAKILFLAFVLLFVASFVMKALRGQSVV
jgi:uncharacterized membrane protein YtjA (UPF0391 family)